MFHVKITIIKILLFLLFILHPQWSLSEELYPVVFGFSQAILGANINANDASAAVKILTRSLAESANIPADPKPVVFENPPQILDSITAKSADIFFITLPELYSVLDKTDDKYMIIPETHNTMGEQYLLLTNKKAGITSLAQLKTKDLIIFSNSRTSLAPYWLENFLSENSQTGQNVFFHNVKKVSKLNDAILPVFFNKADACLVPKKGFETIVELNPQIAKQLNIIANSPNFVPSGLFFRKDYESPIKEQFLRHIDEWVKTPEGLQLLTIFQIDNLIVKNIESLESSLELLKKHQSIKSSNARIKLDEKQ